MKRIIFIITILAFVFSVRAQKILIQKNNGTVESYTFNQSTSKVTFDSGNYKVYIDNVLHNYPSSEVTFVYFTAQQSTTGTLNGHGWVDLGLPSGTKWATCNIGASSSVEYGDYYAWGETSTKNWFGIDNYSYYGSYTIPNNIALTDYDVATIKWGRPWRMPTFTQICELANKCVFQWTTVSGVKGAKFIGPNGNSIFIPAGGGIGPAFGNTSSVSSRSVRGYYWSSSLYQRDSGNFANSLDFDSSGVKLTRTFLGEIENQNVQCFNGLLVRPVTK